MTPAETEGAVLMLAALLGVVVVVEGRYGTLSSATCGFLSALAALAALVALLHMEAP